MMNLTKQRGNKMYKVEFIYKESILVDALENWSKMGKTQDNNNSGGFVFECEEHPLIESGVIRIFVDADQYIYNISDFYRVKITFIA